MADPLEEQSALVSAREPPASRQARERGRIAIIGDLHSAWDPADVEYFNGSAYELLLFTGDLGATGRRDGLRIARSISGLRRPALVMPGNNDVEQFPLIDAELTYRRSQAQLLRTLALGPRSLEGRARSCGFSSHPLTLPQLELTLIAGRPFAAGGGELSFAEALERNFHVGSLDASVERLRSLIDAAPSEHLMLFAHNGPRGLGTAPEAPFGCDFKPEAGDWGDSDLRAAIEYAARRGRRVLAVVAGHMHWHLKTGGQRCWQLRRDGVLYINAARVPRIFGAQGTCRHHLALSLTAAGASVAEVIVASDT